MKLLRITAEGLPLFKEKLDIWFYAQQRVGGIRVESEPRSGTAFFVTFYARPVSNPQEDSTCTEPSS